MQEIEIKKYIIKIILVFVFLAIFVPIVVDIFVFGNSIESNINNESWVSFLGSFLGAIIGGGCTCWAVIMQKYYADKQKQIDEIFSCGKKVSFRKLCKLINIAREYDTVIVHHGDPILKMYYIIILLLLRVRGVSMVHSCYDDMSQLDYGYIKKKIYDFIFQIDFNLSKEVIFVSEAGKESAQAVYKIDDRKCHVIYNGISDEILEDGKINEIDIEKSYSIFYVGRLNKIKGVDLLIKALGDICEKYDVTLGIVGDGAQREELSMLSEELGLDNIITFYGAQTDIRPYLKKANVFVYPSTCQEVFGISIVEAMAYGIPCVANRVGGIPEIIENGKNGFLTECISAEGIRDAIEKVIERYESGDIAKMSKCAKETASRFSIENNCEGILEVLNI